MKDLLYIELREKVREMEGIKHEQSEAERNRCNEDILNAMKLLIDLSNVTRREGLLALEEEVNKFDQIDHTLGLKYLAAIILLVIDGTEPALVEEISLARYFSGDLKAQEGLIYLMYLIGALSIQAGEHPRIIEQKLRAMMPLNIANATEKEQERDNISNKQEKNLDFSEVDELCRDNFDVDTEEPGYFVMKLTDYLFTNLTDVSLQRLLLELDSGDLLLVLKGISGAARKHVFTNCSRRQAVLFAEEMNHLRSVRMRDVVGAAQRILDIHFKLMSCGEIWSDLYESWKPFYDFFAVPEEQYDGWKIDFKECQKKWEEFMDLQK